MKSRNTLLNVLSLALVAFLATSCAKTPAAKVQAAAETAPQAVPALVQNPDATETVNPTYRAPLVEKAEGKFEILSVWRVLEQQPEDAKFNPENLASKSYVAILKSDELTAGRSMLVYGAKGNNASSRSFHFEDEGMKGVTNDTYYSVQVYFPGSSIEVGGESAKWLVVKGSSRLRGKNTNGQAHSDNNYKLYFRELSPSSAEGQAALSLAKAEMNDLYFGTERKVGLFGIEKLQTLKDKTQFKELLELQSRKYGSALEIKSIASLPLPTDFIARKFYSGIEWKNWLSDAGLKSNAEPVLREEYLAEFIKTQLQIKKIEDEASITDERAKSELGASNYTEYAFIRRGGVKGFSVEAQSVGFNQVDNVTGDTQAINGHPALAYGAAKYVQLEIVKVTYHRVTLEGGASEIVKNKEYTWLLTDGSAYRYAPQLELPN